MTPARRGFSEASLRTTGPRGRAIRRNVRLTAADGRRLSAIFCLTVTELASMRESTGAASASACSAPWVVTCRT